MGSSSTHLENPGLLKITFTKIRGSPSVSEINDKLDWAITRMSLYQIPLGVVTHVTGTAHYFLVFDIEKEDRKGNLVCHFTEDGVKHLNFYNSKSEAIFAPFEEKYWTKKVDLLKYRDIEGKIVGELKLVFDLWNKPFNLVLSNCRHFTKFISRRLLNN